jgi:DNA-binding LytR/AlgR family response regulator
MRVLICDDEPLATQRLGDLLHYCDDVEVVGCAETGQEALDQIAAARPDLLLLDIEMPRFDGFDVVEQLMPGAAPAGYNPLVIFVTAYPRFATDAFDTGALDFLTKPVRLARLQSALARARKALAARESERRLVELSRQLEALRAERQQPREERHLWVQRRGEMIRVDLDKVEWIEAEGEYVRLHLSGQSYLHRELLSSIMKQLDPDKFVRIHRSFAINRDRVSSVKRSVHGGSRLVLDGGVELPIGRTYRKSARAALVGTEGAAAEAAAPGDVADLPPTTP